MMSFVFCFLTPCQLGHLTLEDYQIWSVKSALANEFLNLLFQVSIATLRTVVVKLTLSVFFFFKSFFKSECVFLGPGLPHSPRAQARNS